MKNLNTIAAAALFCSMALVQHAQAQTDCYVYNAVQNFSNAGNGWAASYPATGGTAGSNGFVQMPSATASIGGGQYMLVASSSRMTSAMYFGTTVSGTPAITSPVAAGDSMAFFNGGKPAHNSTGAAIAGAETNNATINGVSAGNIAGKYVAYTMTFGSLPPDGTTPLTFTAYAVNPLISGASGTASYSPATILIYTLTNTADPTDVLYADTEKLKMFTASPTNTVGATGWTETVSKPFTVPVGVTSLTLTVSDSIPGTTGGNDFILGGIALSTFSDPFSEPAQVAAGCPLPITGLQLTAQPKGNTVELSWGTLTEINSKNFTVQRSADGGKTWVTINTQPTKALNGNSSVPLAYNAQDIVLQSGSYEYRVVETDIDGSTTTSNVATVNITTSGSAVYPNPTKDYINVVLPATASNATYRLISEDGKIVLSGIMNNEGNHGTIHVAGIASEIYFLEVTVNNATQTYEVQIQQ